MTQPRRVSAASPPCQPQKMGDLNLVQGFAAAYARNTTSVEMHAYLGHYLRPVQRCRGPSHRGGLKHIRKFLVGPPELDVPGPGSDDGTQRAARSLVVSNDSISSSSALSTTSPSTTPEAVHPGKAKAIPIALGVVGGAALFDDAVRPSGSRALAPVRLSILLQHRRGPRLAEDNQRHRSDGLPVVGISTVVTHPQNHEIWAEDPPPDYEG
ncbi:hypothetical protein C8J57DRAFT_1262739 [Mycena rebaudengoi]|nr:hypothetical protein C8J57DRAFT_1262739 [Mycena rebaudengoi]